MKLSRLLLLSCNSLFSVFRILPSIFKKTAEGHAKVIIRFDDYGVWCNSDWITIEKEVVRLHEKYGVKITFGVVPDSKYPLKAHPLSPSVYPKVCENNEYNPYPLTKGSERVAVLKKSVEIGVSEVALHGYSHPKGYSNIINTEFLGLPYDVQYKKLHIGKKCLEDLFECKVTTLIPPHNTYDKLTINIIRDLEFKCISGVRPGIYSPRILGLDVNYLWFNYDNVTSMINILRRKRHFKFEPLSILMLHHTNFTKDGIIDRNKIEEYECLLKYIRDNNIENYCFYDAPENEIKIFDTVYQIEKDNIFMRLVRKYWPRVASNIVKKELTL